VSIAKASGNCQNDSLPATANKHEDNETRREYDTARSDNRQDEKDTIQALPRLAEAGGN
jgi:hypothetical protein